MESPGRWLDVETDHTSPCLGVKMVLDNVVEPLLSQVDSSKHIHGATRTARSMTVASFNGALNLPGPQPDAEVQVEHRQIIQSDVSIPSSKDIHVLLVDDSRVAKSDLGVVEQVEVAWNLVLAQHSLVFV